MAPKTMLDSDVLSAILRREPSAMQRAQTYLESHAQLSFSLITRYEIQRGLKAKRATAQLARFEEFCATCHVLPLMDDVVDRASDIYAYLYRTGTLVGDADILIAATALTNSLVLSTNNTTHFDRVEGLQLVNWLD